MSTNTTLPRRPKSAADISARARFNQILLPWIISGICLLAFLLTLNPWLTLSSAGQGNLAQTARLSGWAWQPEVFGPVYWLATAPLRWLPVTVIPLALNVFSALCASLTLALLVRSVALLPHNRTEQQRLRERSPSGALSIPLAWLPPVFAAVLCAFQLSFWEQATIGSSEMLDLLLFAYITRCLLEFRAYRQDRWVFQALAVYGAATANNWAMVGFAPIFLAALLWMKGLQWNRRFLATAALAGLAGLSFYLLLPLADVLGGRTSATFWQILKMNLGFQKQFVLQLPFNKGALFNSDRPVWVLGLAALLPLLTIAIRWPAYSGDTSKLGNALNTFSFHFFHGALLLLCVWVAFDPEKFSARYLLPGVPLLTFYYLGALAAGYFAGYFLLVFGAKPVGRPRPVAAYVRALDRLVVMLLFALAALAPLGLLIRNLPQIRFANSSLVRQYANLESAALPRSGGIILSDDPRRLVIQQAALVAERRDRDYAFVDTTSLYYPDYQRYLARTYPRRWTNSIPPTRKIALEQVEVLAQIETLSKANDLFYLHPSFGFFFELFYPEPHGMIVQLRRYADSSLLPPPPDPALVASNETFWSQTASPLLARLEQGITPPANKTSLGGRLAGKLHLKREPNRFAVPLAAYFSRSLVYWGAQAQRLGLTAAAGGHFGQALRLNPGNVVAQVNLSFNEHLRTGQETPLEVTKSIEDQFGAYRSWDQVIGANGPFDEPTFCYQQGGAFFQGHNYRQAAQQFARVAELIPDHLASRLLLARVHIATGSPHEALQILTNLHRRTEFFGLSETNAPAVLEVEASAYFATQNSAAAQRVVDAALAGARDKMPVLMHSAQVFLNYGQYPAALQMLNRILKEDPRDRIALFFKGFACAQTGDYAAAIPPLSQLLELETTWNELRYKALLSRANAYLQRDQLDEARADYASIEKEHASDLAALLGLGEIAYRQHHTNAALEHYRLFLAGAPANTVETSNVLTRVKELERAAP